VSNDELDEIEKTTDKQPTMPSAVVKRLVTELLQARWEAENYRRLAVYYKGDNDVGTAIGLRAVSA